MKLIIAGSRHLDEDFVCNEIVNFIEKDPSTFNVTEVVCGGATGADQAGRNYAESKGINIKYFHADWDRYGKSAGPIRNKKMAVYADALLLIWDGKSRGSKNMRDNMLELKKPVYEIIMGDK